MVFGLFFNCVTVQPKNRSYIPTQPENLPTHWIPMISSTIKLHRFYLFYNERCLQVIRRKKTFSLSCPATKRFSKPTITSNDQSSQVCKEDGQCSVLQNGDAQRRGPLFLNQSGNPEYRFRYVSVSNLYGFLL